MSRQIENKDARLNYAFRRGSRKIVIKQQFLIFEFLRGGGFWRPARYENRMKSDESSIIIIADYYFSAVNSYAIISCRFQIDIDT